MTASTIGQPELSEEADPEVSELFANACPDGGPDPVPLELLAPEPSNLIDLAAGEFAGEIRRIWSGPRMGDYLTAPDARRQIWHCWLSSDRAGLNRTFRHDPAHVHRQLMTRKAKDLIENAYGSCPPGLLAALGKIGPVARPATFYRALVKVLGRDDLAAKHLRHCHFLPEKLVLGLAAVPTRLQSRSLFEAIRSERISCTDLTLFAWAAGRVAELGLATLEEIFLSDSPTEALKAVLGRLPFPPPPWSGCGSLTPVASVLELKAAGQDLENCLRRPDNLMEAAFSVLRREAFFYLWSGVSKGLLRFNDYSPLGWAVTEGRGVHNQPLPAATWQDIRAAVRSWPDLAPVETTSDGAVLGTGFLHDQLF